MDVPASVDQHYKPQKQVKRDIFPEQADSLSALFFIKKRHEKGQHQEDVCHSHRAGGKENHRSKGKKQEKINREIKACETFLHVQPTLGALLADLKEEKEPEGGAGVYE